MRTNTYASLFRLDVENGPSISLLAQAPFRMREPRLRTHIGWIGWLHQSPATTATDLPALRPAARASSAVHSWAVPFSCAARPPLLAISRCFSGDIDAKPRRSFSNSVHSNPPRHAVTTAWLLGLYRVLHCSRAAEATRRMPPRLMHDEARRAISTI